MKEQSRIGIWKYSHQKGKIKNIWYLIIPDPEITQMMKLAERDKETVITTELRVFKKPEGAWEMLYWEMGNLRKSPSF